MSNLEFPKIIVNEDIILREFSYSDADEYFKIYTNPLVSKFLPDSMIPNTINDTVLEIESTIQSFQSQYGVYWAIAEVRTNKLIGGCGFHNWNKFDSKIEIAYDLNPEYWGQGVMFYSLQRIIEFAFLKMKVVRIQGIVLEENTSSIKLLTKLGFQKEGILRKYKFFKQKNTNIAMFSILKEEFEIKDKCIYF
jgi:[ribosomal protein S5]-alanine N-acetyltransferase